MARQPAGRRGGASTWSWPSARAAFSEIAQSTDGTFVASLSRVRPRKATKATTTITVATMAPKSPVALR